MFVSGSTGFKNQPIEKNYNYSAEQNVKLDNKIDVFGTPNLPENKHSISKKLTEEAIQKVNKAMINSDRRLEYKIHEATKQLIVKVVNTSNGETVREIPNEKILDMVANMCKTAGIFVDEKR